MNDVIDAAKCLVGGIRHVAIIDVSLLWCVLYGLLLSLPVHLCTYVCRNVWIMVAVMSPLHLISNLLFCLHIFLLPLTLLPLHKNSLAIVCLASTLLLAYIVDFVYGPVARFYVQWLLFNAFLIWCIYSSFSLQVIQPTNTIAHHYNNIWTMLLTLLSVWLEVFVM